MPGPCTELASARPETLRWHCAGTRSPAHAVAGTQLAICMARAMESPAITIERPCIYQRAADAGEPIPMYSIGCLNADGRIAAHDAVEGYMWLLLAKRIG